MSPMDTLRASALNLDLFCKLHPIIEHDPVMALARAQLADAIHRLEVAIGRSVTVANVERNYP